MLGDNRRDEKTLVHSETRLHVLQPHHVNPWILDGQLMSFRPFFDLGQARNLVLRTGLLLQKPSRQPQD